MNEADWMQRLSLETQQLYALLSTWRILLFVLLVVATILLGRILRKGAHLLWRLGLDPEHRLAPVGASIQVIFAATIVLSAFGMFIRTAPLASFALMIALSPLLVLLVQRPGRNALAGLTILFRRNFIEGDHIVLVRQIGLTSTVARTDAGGRLVIPNARLLDVVLVVNRRQSGVPLVLRFQVDGRPSEAMLAQVRRVGILSPFRAGDSIVGVDYVAIDRELEVTVRLPRSQAEDGAKRELSQKILEVLASSS
jgi:small-conductance mechanosensitive channel